MLKDVAKIKFEDIVCNKPAILLAEEASLILGTGGIWDINISDIASILIKTAGECCECCASDLFTLWDRVRIGLDRHARTVTEVSDSLYTFGFKHNGVDDKHTVYNNLLSSDATESLYNKILVLKVHDRPGFDTTQLKHIYITLYDITETIKLIGG